MKAALFISFILFSSDIVSAQSILCKKTIDSILATPRGMISNESKKHINSCIYEIQTEGFNLAEQACKFDSARIKIEHALRVWEHLEDTLNKANLLKYLGFLNGKLKQFNKGKTQIAEAIRLYSLKKAEWGVAVSWFDLSKLYEYENKTDSAILFSDKALQYWTGKNNSRVMILNNNLINLYTLTGRVNEAGKLIEENGLIAKGHDLYWLELLDFYYLANKHYENLKEIKNALYYSELYNNKIEEVKNTAGRKRYSIYDERHCHDR